MFWSSILFFFEKFYLYLERQKINQDLLIIYFLRGNTRNNIYLHLFILYRRATLFSMNYRQVYDLQSLQICSPLGICRTEKINSFVFTYTWSNEVSDIGVMQGLGQI